MEPVVRVVLALMLGGLLGCSPEPRELVLPAVIVPAVGDPGCLKINALPPLRFTGAQTERGENIEARIDRELGGEGLEKLSIRFPAAGGVPPTPGTYALGSGENTRFSTCSACVSVLEDLSGVNLGHLNFATQGTLLLEAVNAANGEYRGILSNVVLRSLLPSVSVGWDGLDPNIERCLALSDVRFDTFANQHPSCATTEDCVNQKKEVCDPDTLRCVPSQCSDDDMLCPADRVCRIQHPTYLTGACFRRCEPFLSNACGDGNECVSTRYAGGEGICKKAGFAPLGKKACTSSTLSTGCQPGAVCQTIAPVWPDEQYCVATCDNFSKSPGCATGLCRLYSYGASELRQYCYTDRCHFGGTCGNASDIDPAEIGQKCAAPLDTPCAAGDGLAARGVCTGTVCELLCPLGAPSCPLGTTCVQYVTSDSQNTALAGIGVCR